jgi:hypothetical protein
MGCRRRRTTVERQDISRLMRSMLKLPALSLHAPGLKICSVL